MTRPAIDAIVFRNPEQDGPRAKKLNDITWYVSAAYTVITDPTIAALAGLTGAADKVPYFNGVDTMALADFPSFGRTLVANTTAADARTDLAISATNTPFTPAGAIAATDVQAALVELDTEKLAASLYTAADVLAKLLTVDGTGSGLDADLLDGANLDLDGTLAANSDSRIASQKAVKTYVDTAVTGLLDFKGSTNCSGNPNYPAASKGDAYIVSTAGKVGGASGKSVDVGDIYLATADNAGGTEASVGTSWSVLEHNLVGALLAANNLSDLASASTARSNLGLGTAATQNTGTSGANVPLMNGANAWSGIQTIDYSIIANGASGASQLNDRSTGSTDAWIFYASGGSLRFFQQNGLTDRVTVSTTGLDVNGEARCNSLRIDAAPTVSAAATSHKLPVNLNGTTYYILLSNV